MNFAHTILSVRIFYVGRQRCKFLKKRKLQLYGEVYASVSVIAEVEIPQLATTTTTDFYTPVIKLLGAKSATFPTANTSWCRLLGVK